MKRPITIISCISSLLFLVAIIWFGAGIYIDKKSGGEKAQSRYERLLDDTKSALTQSTYGTSDFSNKFIRAIGNIDDFSTLKLEINGELVYSYPPNTFSLPSADLVKHFEEEVFVNSESQFKLEASLYLMKPNSIYNYARIAFLLILVGTIIVVVLIILTNGTDDTLISTRNNKFKKREYSDIYRPFAEEKTQEYEEVKETKETTSHAKTESVVKSEAKNTSESNSTPVKPIFNPEPAKKTEEKPEIETEEISINFDDDTPVTHTSRNSNVNDWFVDTKATEATGEDEGLDIIDQFEQQNAEESDIFSEDSEEEPVFEAIPVTLDDIDSQNETEEIQEENIPDFTAEEPGLPEHSEQKPARNSSQITGLLLENELEPFIDEQIANGKNNLTITLIKINSLDRGNSISGKIVSLIKNHISSDNPELFEYKADSYAVVMADADLQNTVDKFEGIYNEVSDFLKDNNSVNEVSVGISSVAGRKIKAERLLLEASQALDYASSDPDSPIVAFRANPEKYREIEEA